jgi:hypothetical protein
MSAQLDPEVILGDVFLQDDGDFVLIKDLGENEKLTKKACPVFGISLFFS